MLKAARWPDWVEHEKIGPGEGHRPLMFTVLLVCSKTTKGHVLRRNFYSYGIKKCMLPFTHADETLLTNHGHWCEKPEKLESSFIRYINWHPCHTLKQPYRAKRDGGFIEFTSLPSYMPYGYKVSGWYHGYRGWQKFSKLTMPPI